MNQYIYGGITVLICSLLIVVYIQTGSIKQLNKDVTALEIQVKEADLIKDQLKEGLESQQIVNEKLIIVNKEIKQQLNTIKTHDLENIALKKPKLLERRVNDATDKIWNDIACISDDSRVCD